MPSVVLLTLSAGGLVALFTCLCSHPTCAFISTFALITFIIHQFPKMAAVSEDSSSGDENDHAEEELPAWCSRPFCRSNTQSEPEDCCHVTGQESSEDELECHRGCTDYYYCSKRNSSEIREMERAGRGGGVAGQFRDKRDNETCRSKTESGANVRTDDGARLAGDLREGLRLVFLVALPMLARHLGALVSRRLLGHLFRRPAV